MKQFLQYLLIILFIQPLHSMNFNERPTNKIMLVSVLSRFEKKEVISEITYHSISKSPEFQKMLLTHFNEQDLTTLYDLDVKERCGKKSISNEQADIEKITAAFKKALLVCEDIHFETKRKCIQEYEENLERYKQQTSRIIKIFLNEKIITQCTYDALLQAQHFDSFLNKILEKPENKNALESCIESIKELQKNGTLNRIQEQKLNAGQARILSLKPLKVFESISRTLEWIGKKDWTQKNDILLSQACSRLIKTDEFLKFHEALRIHNINRFLLHYEYAETPNNQAEKSPNLADIYNDIREYIDEQEFAKELKFNQDLENLHLRTSSSDNKTPRTGTPSPETEPEKKLDIEITPISCTRRISEPPSPSIDIKNGFRKLKENPDVK